MIKTEGLTTEVEFARQNGKGTVSVQAFHNCLVLQEIIGDKKVSDPLLEGDIKELPTVVCDFQTIESVDVVIEILKRVRKNINEINSSNFAMAC
jgi:hypothetical protein